MKKNPSKVRLAFVPKADFWEQLDVAAFAFKP